jgi:hypothetical protein
VRRSLVVLLLVLLVAAVGACADEPADEYSEATERAFMRACVAGLGRELESVCECSYERIERRVPFDEYEEMNRRLTNDPDDIPDELVDIVAGCAAPASED